MPNKRTHDWVLIAMSGGIIASGPAYGPVVMPLAVGVLMGMILSPDLDVANQRPKTIWNMYWWLYSRFIPHRHPLSHMPLISTMIRLIYLPVIPLFVWLSLTGRVSELGWWVFKWCVIGLIFADVLHTILDVVVSNWRKI